MPGVRGGNGDGRVLRGRRNREAVVGALLQLVEEGDIKPTAEAISERAGISRRSVFQHFADVESIYEAASTRTGELLLPFLVPVDQSLSRAERIGHLMVLRRRLLDTVDPLARSARLREPFSEQLTASRHRLSAKMRAQCRQAIGPELADLEADDADELVDAVAGATSWSLYNHLCADLDLEADRAIAVMTRLVVGLLDAGQLPAREVVSLL
jgi:TetR/AcrR family transcriptional regulator of autoinduction and epiphytic fitness